ncbi:MAG: hypothetical protein WCT04_20765 [Planctomycetota bacterium]
MQIEVMPIAAQCLRNNGLYRCIKSKLLELKYYARPESKLHDGLIRLALHEPLSQNRECVSVLISSQTQSFRQSNGSTRLTLRDELRRRHIAFRRQVASYFHELQL